jgi:hypothetical protein
MSPAQAHLDETHDTYILAGVKVSGHMLVPVFCSSAYVHALLAASLHVLAVPRHDVAHNLFACGLGAKDLDSKSTRDC